MPNLAKPVEFSAKPDTRTSVLSFPLGISKTKQNAKTVLVRLTILIRMLIKSQLEVRLHTGRTCMYTSTPSHLPDPPFRFLEGLVPRLCHTHLGLLVGFDIQPRMRVVLAIKPVCVHEARVHKSGQLE